MRAGEQITVKDEKIINNGANQAGFCSFDRGRVLNTVWAVIFIGMVPLDSI